MAKNEKRTLNVILDELNKVVDAYNKLDVADVTRADLTKQAKDLCTEYNELSLLTVYGTCAEAAMPLKAFVEAFEYTTVSTKDAPHKVADKEGGMRLVFTKSVTEGTKDLNLTKFIEWAAEANVSVTASKNWKVKFIAAREAIKDEWRKFQAAGGDSHSISIKKLKKALQDLFDALIIIPTEKGNNAVVATGNIAKTAFQFASQTKRGSNKLVMGEVLPDNLWNTILMKSLLAAVQGKALIVDFDGEEADDKQEEAADQPKPAAPKKASAKKAKPAAEAEPATEQPSK